MATATAKPLDEETVKKVIRQVEFYFGDSNLPRDKFLSELVSKNEDGLVDLTIICSFTRMKTHLHLGDIKAEEIPEETVKAVAETLRSSPFLKLSDDGKKVGRAFELPKPEEVIQQLDNRTIAASPFEYDVKLEDVESFFSQFAKVSSVRLPRHVADKRLFCGTSLIEFSTEEDAQRILKQSLVHAGVELELKTKKDFDEERVKQEEATATTHFAMGKNDKNSPAVPNYTKGLIIAFSLKKMSPEDSVEENTLKEPSIGNDENAEKPAEETEKENVETPEEKDEADDEEKVVPEKNKDRKDQVSREDLKEVFNKFGNVKYIEFAIGESSGFIRFEDAEAGQKARAAAALTEEGGLIIKKSYIATLDAVTGVAEKEYWEKLKSGQGKYKDYKNNNRGGGAGGRGGRGNRGGGRHHNGKNHRSGDHSNEMSNRPNKIQKIVTTTS